MVRIALPHDRNKVVWNNGNNVLTCRAVSRSSDWTWLSARFGPARGNPDGEEVTVKGVTFNSFFSSASLTASKLRSRLSGSHVECLNVLPPVKTNLFFLAMFLILFASLPAFVCIFAFASFLL